MKPHVALLRAVNVGGTGKLAMSDLTQLCLDAGLIKPKTYIQSGNVVFLTKLAEPQLKSKLEKALATLVGKPTAVLIRPLAELEATLERNPFPTAPPNRVVVFFLDAPPPLTLSEIACPAGERLHLEGRHLFVHYPNGQGVSKLKLPFTTPATARNLNTLNALAALSRALA